MCGVTGAIVAGSVVTAGASVYGAQQASSSAGRSANAATAENSRQFDTIRADTAPQRALGQGATGLLARLYGIGMPGEAPTFDAVQYLRDNPDVAADAYFGSRPQEHFQRHGRAEGRAAPMTAGSPATQGGAPDQSAFTESPDYRFNLQENQRALDRSLLARGRGLSGAGVREGMRLASGMASGEYGNYFNRLSTLAGMGSAATNTSAQAGLTTAANNANIITNAGNTRASAYMQGAAGVNNSVQGALSNYILLQQLNRPPPPYMNSGGYGGTGSYNGGGMRVS